MTLGSGFTPHHRRRTLGGRRLSMAPSGLLDKARESRRTAGESLGPSIAQLDSAFTSLEKNLRNLQSLNDSLDSFNDAFACLLDGLTLNATAGVTFPEAPTSLSFRRSKRSLYNLPSLTPPTAPLTRPSEPDWSTGSRGGQLIPTQVDTSQIQDKPGLVLQNTSFLAPPSSSSPLTSTPITSKGSVAHGGAVSARRVSKLPVRKSQIPLPSTPMGKMMIKKKSSNKATDTDSASDRTTRRTRRKDDLPIRRIIQSLPSKYRHPPHAEVLRSVLSLFAECPQSSLSVQEVVRRSGAPKHRCIEYLNVLVSTAHLLQTHRRGIHYRLNPARHPIQSL